MADKSKGLTKKQIVFEFLVKHPESQFKDVHAHFSDMNLNSLRAYFSAWNAEKNGGRKTRKPREVRMGLSSKDQKLILAFKKVIERQEKQIDALSAKFSALKKEKKLVEEKILKPLAGLSTKQKKEVFTMVETFARGLAK